MFQRIPDSFAGRLVHALDDSTLTALVAKGHEPDRRLAETELRRRDRPHNPFARSEAVLDEIEQFDPTLADMTRTLRRSFKEVEAAASFAEDRWDASLGEGRN